MYIKMKNISKLIGILLLIFGINSCNNDNFGDTNFVDKVVDASDLKLTYTVSTDNKGTTVFTPNGKGVLYYIIDFGDKSKESDKIKPGETITHTYREDDYKATLKAYNGIGKFTTKTVDVKVAFKAPENLKVTVESDKVVAKKVNVTVTGDFATSYDVYFRESAKNTIINATIGKTVSYTYASAGKYKLKVVVKGQAKANTTVSANATAILLNQPLTSANNPPARDASKYISIYSDRYINVSGVNAFPDWGQASQGSHWGTFKIGDDNILKYSKLSYQGIQISSAGNDVSGMTHLHLDIWTPEDGVKIKIFLIHKNKVEKFVLKTLAKKAWTSIDIPLSEYTSQGLSLDVIHQFKFEEHARPWAKNDVFIDNIYFYKN